MVINKMNKIKNIFIIFYFNFIKHKTNKVYLKVVFTNLIIYCFKYILDLSKPG